MQAQEPMRTFALAVCLPLLPPLAAQAVLRVGPARPFATIQAAVGAAVDGDVIAVDTGTYPAFAIVGKRLAVVADQGAGGPFTVLGAPAIAVSGLGPGQTVTIAHAVANATVTGPAIAIANAGSGDVRLQHVTVLGGHFGTVPYRGLVEVVTTGSLWCEGLRAGDYRFRADGASGSHGLAALFVDATPTCLDGCVLQGMRADLPTTAGGDAVRCMGPTTLWAIDCHLVGGMAPLNALPGVLGGHAVHDAGGQARGIRLCGCTLLTTDPAAAAFAVAGVPSYTHACLPESLGRTDLPVGVTAVAPGTTAVFTVTAEVGNRVFATLLAAGFGSSSLPILEGALLVDSSFAVLTAGVLQGPVTVPLALPPWPGLTGLQATVQSVLVEAPPAVSYPTTAAAFTIR